MLLPAQTASWVMWELHITTRLANSTVKLKCSLTLPLPSSALFLCSDDPTNQVRHHCPDDLSLRKELIARLAERVRFALMEAEALHDTVLGAPEADSEAVRAMVQEGLWFKCFSFERQQEQIQVRRGVGEREGLCV